MYKINLKVLLSFTMMTFLLLGGALSTFAQSVKLVRGKVISKSTGSPIGGVSVTNKSTNKSTSTNNSGAFEIDAAEKNTLVFSYVGFANQSIVLSNQNNLTISLVENNAALDEVVVVAYGTAKKKDLTGAISTIDNKALQNQSNSTVSRALEGAAPGIQVSAVDGQPGIDMGIRIRGLGSASQNNSDALVVIDGVPAQNANPLATISAKDIENVTILKDAASTALYGARGANGVVLVTTKRGKKGEPKVTLETKLGFNQVGPYQFDKITDPKDIYEMTWLSIYNSARYGVDGSGKSQNYTTNLKNPNMSHDDAATFASAHLFDYTGSMSTFARNTLGNFMSYNVPGAVYTKTGTGANESATMSGAYLVNTDGKLNPNAKLLYTDRYDDYVLKNSFRQEYNLSISGGGDKVDYFFSGGYLEDPSYIVGSSFKRYNGRANVNAQVYDWLKIGTNVMYGSRNTQSFATRFGRNPGSGTANVFRYINGQNQLIPMYARDQNGEIIMDNGVPKVHVLAGDTYSPVGPTSGGYGSTNLLKMLDMDVDRRISNDLNTRSYAQIKLMKNLLFTSNFSLDKYNEIRTRYWNSQTGQAAGEGDFGKVFSDVMILNAQQLLNYNNQFGDHTIEGLLGFEYDSYHSQTLNYNSSNELIPEFITFANFVGRYNGGTFASPGGGEDIRRMASYFGRANYNYKDKYFLQASLRRDGSSKFKLKDKRWGTFWSVGAGWRISQEEFMKGTSSWLNELKVRSSYGVIGNQNGVSNYSGYQTWGYGAVYNSTTNGTGVPNTYTISQGSYVNDQLTWEDINTFDAGIDFSLFNRLRGSIDVYSRTTTNAIWAQPMPLSKGQSSLLTNSARLNNKGFEIELSLDLIKNSDFNWTISTNGTTYRTILKDVPKGVGSTALNGNWTATTDAWAAAGTGAASGFFYLRGVGKDYYNLYMFKYAGVDDNTGLPSFYQQKTQKDADAGLYADFQVGESFKTTDYSKASRYEMGTAIPDWVGGFSTSFRYKNFDLYGAFAYQIGGKFFSTEYANGLYLSELTGTPTSSELLGNTWTPENPDAKFPMMMYNNTYGNGATFGSWLYSDMALFNASYFNLKNITVGYTIPEHLLTRFKMKRVRVYASGDNLNLFTSHSGIDPRMSLVGGFEVGAYSYPSMRTFTFGINFDF